MHLSHQKPYLSILRCPGSALICTISKEREGKQKSCGDLICSILIPDLNSRLQETNIDTLCQLQNVHFLEAIIEAEGYQKKLYSIIKSLTAVKSDMPLPQHTSTQQLAKDFGQFFIKKIEDIRSELNAPANLPIP